jgi:hypothetical protein
MECKDLKAPILNESECLAAGCMIEADFEDLVLQKLTAILSPRAVVSSGNSPWLMPIESPCIFEGELTPHARLRHPPQLRPQHISCRRPRSRVALQEHGHPSLQPCWQTSVWRAIASARSALSRVLACESVPQEYAMRCRRSSHAIWHHAHTYFANVA